MSKVVLVTGGAKELENQFVKNSMRTNFLLSVIITPQKMKLTISKRV